MKTFLSVLLVVVISFVFWSANNGDQKTGLSFAAVSAMDTTNVNLVSNFALTENRGISVTQDNKEELKKIISEVAASAAEDEVIKNARLIMNAH